jgi:hypothetical protein
MWTRPHDIPTLKFPLPFGRSLTLSYALRTFCVGVFPPLLAGRVLHCYSLTISLKHWLVVRTTCYPNGEMENKAWGLKFVCGESAR